MVSKEDIKKALRRCTDPEIAVNIVDLGLVYDIKVNKGNVDIKMTMTSIGCPLSEMITEQVRQEVKKIKGVKKVDVNLVWDPPWSPERVSKEARAKLGL